MLCAHTPCIKWINVQQIKLNYCKRWIFKQTYGDTLNLSNSKSQGLLVLLYGVLRWLWRVRVCLCANVIKIDLRWKQNQQQWQPAIQATRYICAYNKTGPRWVLHKTHKSVRHSTLHQTHTKYNMLTFRRRWL